MNRLPQASSPQGITPYEAYFHRKPDLSSFRIFRYTAYFWLNQSIPSLPASVSVSTIDAYRGTGSVSLSRTACGIFVGYDKHRHAYHILPGGASQYVIAQVTESNYLVHAFILH